MTQQRPPRSTDAACDGILIAMLIACARMRCALGASCLRQSPPLLSTPLHSTRLVSSPRLVQFALILPFRSAVTLRSSHCVTRPSIRERQMSTSSRASAAVSSCDSHMNQPRAQTPEYDAANGSAHPMNNAAGDVMRIMVTRAAADVRICTR
jgi:hypothetical protein